MPLNHLVYKGRAWGLYAPEIFEEFMNGDFKTRCRERGIPVTVNPEPIEGGKAYHLSDIGIGIFYRSDGVGAMVELRGTRPVHVNLVERIIKEEQER